MSFTIEKYEFLLLIVVRLSTFVFSAPFFSIKNIPIRVKVGLSIFLAIIVFQMVNYEPLIYVGTVGFAIIIVREAMVGLLLGFFSSVCLYIINFAGQIIDTEIGFSMVTLFDPVTQIQTSITSNYYSYFVMLMLMVTNMHYYIIRAILDSFRVVPIGQAVINPNIYKIFLGFVVDYFIIGFRIVLPIFSCILIVNVVLGVLARVAPQMNMFVIGFQLKIFVGLFVLLLIVGTIPSISDFIFQEIKEMVTAILASLAPR